MAVAPITLAFNPTFEGVLTAPNATINVGVNEGTIAPYHMLFGALGSCFYATFLDVTKKKRLTFEHALIEISGEKREAVPATLKHVTLHLIITGADKTDQFIRSAELGAKFCSIYETIKQVAEMELKVSFK